MENHWRALGRLSFLTIPIAIGLSLYFPSFWVAIGVGAAIGAGIANIRAVLFVGDIRRQERENPMLQLQSISQGIDSSTHIRFIFGQSLVGGFVVGLWTASVFGIMSLF